MEIRHFFTDGDDLYIGVSQEGRFCYLYAATEDVAGNDTEIITKETIREYLVNNNENILSLPHIEDATTALQYLYKELMQSDNNMYFVDPPEDGGNSEWEDIGLTKEQFIEQVRSDIKKYHLEDVIAYMEDVSIFTCYGGLQGMFTTKD